ncbi:MAG: haloacid dehalogenase type II [Dehalococcoidia bacterium]
MSLESIRAITLDLYGTVLDVESSVLQAFDGFLQARGYAGAALEVVQAWSAAYFQETLIDTMLGRGRTPFEQISRSTLSQVLSRRGVANTPEEVEGLLSSRDRGRLFPDAQEALPALRNGYTLALLSNGDLASLERAVSNMSIPVDRIISAEQAGVFKPHPEVYHTAVTELGLEPGQVLHVAAHAWDIRGARAFGMRGAYVNRAGIPYGDSPFPPDLEVADFRELAARIG